MRGLLLCTGTMHMVQHYIAPWEFSIKVTGISILSTLILVTICDLTPVHVYGSLVGYIGSHTCLSFPLVIQRVMKRTYDSGQEGLVTEVLCKNNMAREFASTAVHILLDPPGP